MTTRGDTSTLCAWGLSHTYKMLSTGEIANISADYIAGDISAT